MKYSYVENYINEKINKKSTIKLFIFKRLFIMNYF